MDYRFKILLLGNYGTGKSSILQVSNGETFNTSYSSTIGVDFKCINMVQDGKNIKLQVWDTGGQDRFHSIITSYYRNISYLIIVYDITDIKSFYAIKDIIKDYQFYTNKYDTPILILGNKSDLNQREVDLTLLEQLALEYDCLYQECSAKTGENLNNIYDIIVSNIINLLNVNKIKPTDSNGIKIEKTPKYNFHIDNNKKRSDKCCTIL